MRAQATTAAAGTAAAAASAAAAAVAAAPASSAPAAAAPAASSASPLVRLPLLLLARAPQQAIQTTTAATTRLRNRVTRDHTFVPNRATLHSVTTRLHRII
jgi:hypothetical protein